MGGIEDKPRIIQPYISLYRKQAVEYKSQKFLGETRLTLPVYTRATFIFVLIDAVIVAGYLLWVSQNLVIFK